MALTPGTRLGVCEVTAPLGEGGMGQVWRATDGAFVTSLGSTTSTFLVSTDGWAVYAPPGALLLPRGTTLMRQPFDTTELQLTGEPAPVAEAIGLPGGLARRSRRRTPACWCL